MPSLMNNKISVITPLKMNTYSSASFFTIKSGNFTVPQILFRQYSKKEIDIIMSVTYICTTTLLLHVFTVIIDESSRQSFTQYNVVLLKKLYTGYFNSTRYLAYVFSHFTGRLLSSIIIIYITIHVHILL